MFIKATVITGFALAFTERKGKSQERLNSFPAMYSPPNTFKTDFVNTNTKRSALLSTSDLAAKAMDWATANLQATSQDAIVQQTAHLDSLTGLYHCYMLKQTQGLDIVNSVAQMTMSNTGNLIAVGTSWVKTSEAAPVKRDAGISCADAVKTVASSLGVKTNPAGWTVSQDGNSQVFGGVEFAIGNVTCRDAVYKTANSLVNVHDIVAPGKTMYLNVMVDKNGKILGAADWTSSIAYTSEGRVVKRQAVAAPPPTQFLVNQIGDKDPRTTKQNIQNNPEDLTSSVDGWVGNKNITQGNNVVAAENAANQAPNQAAANVAQGNKNLAVFDNPVDDVNQEPPQYVDASITRAFFLANRYHDILNNFGFTEAAGNFQEVNASGKGKGGDSVIALVQDGSGTNNANFQTPPDGQNGVMRMFIFTTTQPNRDGASENAVVLHELTHGLSGRLTGGAATANCLNGLESGGLGEGWSDAMAIALELKATNTPQDNIAIGQYVTGDKVKGVRSQPFSTDTKTNTKSFQDVPTTPEVHAIGEVWTSMLFEVMWNMITANGFDNSFLNPKNGKPDLTKGNTQYIQNVVTGMKIQPCNPSFVDARDAIVAADKQLFNGANKCAITNGFAKRGLGANAKDDKQFVNNFDKLPGC
ncbi:ammonium transporter [Terramyces sp. JEL0728]|nr:ammonium transporter [Terramyces sp. JEL0728]